jgi:uncharacterized protein YaeQ
MDRNIYQTLPLTVAQHPSETTERMMARVLAFCINADEQLSFTKGLSSTEEPDIWKHSLDNQILLWIDVGEPNPERIKKATRIAKSVKVYSFNSKSNVWWQQEAAKFATLKAEIFRFDWPGIQALAALVERTMEFSITISENSAFVSAQKGECQLSCTLLSELKN